MLMVVHFHFIVAPTMDGLGNYQGIKGLDYHPGSEYSTTDVRFDGIFHRIITIAVELSCGSLNRCLVIKC